MRRICYSAAMSLDGYVAGPKGESDWIVMDPEIDFRALFARFDTLLMGRRTYEAASGMGHGGAMPGLRSIVVSNSLDPGKHPGVTIIGEGLETELDRLRSTPGKDIWLFGGGGLFKSLLELGRVDSIEVSVIPVLLGGGTPLLPPGGGRRKLRLVQSRTLKTTGTVMLEYAAARR